jgi:D-2-hydroxyacid dehydrogenase (NADP+)
MIISLIPIKHLKDEYIKLIEAQTGEKIIRFDENSDNKILNDAEIIIAFNKFDNNILKHCNNLKWIYSFSSGVEKFPIDELIKKNVILTNNRGVHATQIAEQALGYMINFNRLFHISIRNQIIKKWEKNYNFSELSGKTVCIIGAGTIGKEIARKAKAFDMNVIGVKKNPEKLEYFDTVSGTDKLLECLGYSDYNVLITPLTDETFHFIGEKEFKSMKKSSYFINISRGDTVDENALIDALINRNIAGAGLDVFHNEPLIPDSHLWEMENVILTPHTAGICPDVFKKSLDIFFKSYECFKLKKELPNIVDLKRKY